MSGGSFQSPARACSARPSRPARLAPVCPACLLDHLVRQHEEVRRYREPQGLRRLEVEHQLERHRLLYGEIGGLGALEDLIHVCGSAPVPIHNVIRVG